LLSGSLIAAFQRWSEAAEARSVSAMPFFADDFSLPTAMPA